MTFKAGRTEINQFDLTIRIRGGVWYSIVRDDSTSTSGDGR